MNKKEHIIKVVEKGSIAEELELEPGDVLLEVNGKEMQDVFDYHYYMNEEYLEVLVRKANGEEWELEIEKEYEDDLGIEFDNGLMDEYRSCRNKCIFCFIDQLPPNMRETLYFKDDDTRLSFLQGNYITLTNLSDADVDRVVEYHLSPINISFQTMNPELRCKMLNNRFAGDSLEKVKKFYDAGIIMNGQIVLCKDVNDKDELEYSILELTKYLPFLQSVSVVPVGITKYREGLYPLEPFGKEDAIQVLDTIHSWQERLLAEHGTHFIHAGDEWYLLAEREIPAEETYDGYLQLENGVGMIRLFQTEIETYLKTCKEDDVSRKISIATGKLVAPILEEVVEGIKEKYPNIQVQVYAIENKFFGEKITVAGLVTGQDILEQLKNKDLGESLLITEHMLRDGETVFLDDFTVEDMEKALQVPVTIVESDGKAFLEAVKGEKI